MPLSFAIPFGFVMVILGAILFFTTRYKRAAKIVIGVGIVIALLTVIFILLAAKSQM